MKANTQNSYIAIMLLIIPSMVLMQEMTIISQGFHLRLVITFIVDMVFIVATYSLIGGYYKSIIGSLNTENASLFKNIFKMYVYIYIGLYFMLMIQYYFITTGFIRAMQSPGNTLPSNFLAILKLTAVPANVVIVNVIMYILWKRLTKKFS